MERTKAVKDYFLFAEAWCFLAMARCMLVFLPFKKVVPFLCKVTTATVTNIENDNAIFTRISLAISRGSYYSPWRAKCLEQALAAKMMLKRRGYSNTIYFGIHKSETSQKIKAHAWLETNGVIITGGNNLEQYTVISSFKS